MVCAWVEENFYHGMSKKSSGLGKRSTVTKIWVVTDYITAMPEIKDLFNRHQFEWMTDLRGIMVRGSQKSYMSYMLPRS